MINLLQYFTILHLTRKLSGISPVSPYTINVYVHLFKDNIYLTADYLHVDSIMKSRLCMNL